VSRFNFCDITRLQKYCDAIFAGILHLNSRAFVMTEKSSPSSPALQEWNAAAANFSAGRDSFLKAAGIVALNPRRRGSHAGRIFQVSD
jgi:hypothetical protein